MLITGETGTGKELVARAIHQRSSRAARPFVSVNCAAIPPGLDRVELFGHEQGAFTGAVQRRLGRFELAARRHPVPRRDRGAAARRPQVALLRVLQEREFERVGGNAPIRVDVRVIAATNRDLETAIADEDLSADLFYRLNVFPIEVPALRDRRGDIPLLVGILHSSVQYPRREADRARFRRQRGGPAALRLARQHPGIAERDRTRRDHLGRLGAVGRSAVALGLAIQGAFDRAD